MFCDIDEAFNSPLKKQIQEIQSNRIKRDQLDNSVTEYQNKYELSPPYSEKGYLKNNADTIETFNNLTGRSDSIPNPNNPGNINKYYDAQGVMGSETVSNTIAPPKAAIKAGAPNHSNVG